MFGRKKRKKESKFTVMARLVSDRANNDGDPKDIAQTIQHLTIAIQGLGRLPPPVSDVLWDILLKLFGKLIAAAGIAQMPGHHKDEINTKAEVWLNEINEGFHGPIRDELDRVRAENKKRLG